MQQLQSNATSVEVRSSLSSRIQMIVKGRRPTAWIVIAAKLNSVDMSTVQT